MKLMFKQRLFSWFDSYDIYDEQGQTVYTVKGELSWGHLLRIYDAAGNPVGVVKQKVWSFLPRFELYRFDEYIGCITKEFSLFKPRFQIDYNGWQVEGNWFEWDYSIQDSLGKNLATVSKQLWNLTDTYVIEFQNPEHSLYLLMLVLAIDAEKCSRED